MAKKKEETEIEVMPELDIELEKADLQTRMTQLMIDVSSASAKSQQILNQSVDFEQSAMFVGEKFTDAVEVRNFKAKMDVINSALGEANEALDKVLIRITQAKD